MLAREIKEDRTKFQSSFPFGNDCKHFTNCHKRQMCGADIEASNKNYKRCRGLIAGKTLININLLNV